ncbi:MAG TPA: hypothetical protein VH110_01480 [Candidatus Acidoferrum sp.]|jgi:hypothetical protein|nr:hypothetical protein [Candidatus Acidoferrum sp.]
MKIDYRAILADVAGHRDQLPLGADLAPEPGQPSLVSDPGEEQVTKTKSGHLVLKVALVIGAISSLGLVVFRQPRAADPAASDVAARTDGVSPADASVIPDIRNWTAAKPSELSLNFTEWLRGFGVEPASKIAMDSKGAGEPSGAAYLLLTDKTPGMKRVVWVADHQVVYDSVGKIQGIAKLSRESMSRISWSKSGTPVETAEGDGLLLIRDYTSPNGTTVFFIKNRKLCSGVPANITNLELR